MTKRMMNFLVLFALVLGFSLQIANAITGEVITGEATQENVGASVTIVGGLVITIHSPENKTYIFGVDETAYPISLNVSSDTEVESWRYTLEDLDTHIILNNSVSFPPNTTIYAALGSNKITVHANTSEGGESEASVVFRVRGTNTDPEFGAIPSEILVCENDALFYLVNATDVDTDDLTLDLSPSDLFFIFPTFFTGSSFVESQVFSASLGKSEVGTYEEVISITDGEGSDVEYVNITVIEVNNIPSLSAVGVQTVWARGENNSFYKQAQVTDVEDGTQVSGNFNFNLTYQNGTPAFFGVSSVGVMNFTANTSLLGVNNSSQVYNMTLCVTDTGLDSPHQNISFCEQDGSAITSCNNFSLTVTSQNRAPEIETYSPLSLGISSESSSTLSFNISKSDPDGTVPDSYWYVDNTLNAYRSGQSSDLFNYSFGCGIGGAHEIEVVISDGELNDSVAWNVSLNASVCLLSEGDGRGGTLGGVSCASLWACEDWLSCENLGQSLSLSAVSGERYRSVQEDCTLKGWNSETCGFQARTCSDFASCGYNPPETLQSCYYTENPSCSDGIKNCHDGSCEFLVDCGGSCGVCATCSDGIQNQGEEGTDCGGSCPVNCASFSPEENSFLEKVKGLALYSLDSTGKYIWILVVLLVILAIKVVQIFRHKRAFQNIGRLDSAVSLHSELR